MKISNTKTTVKNSYVCSPAAHYVDYGIEKINIDLKVKKLLMNSSLKAVNILDKFFAKKDFKKVVYVNNWLLSTTFKNKINILKNYFYYKC